MIWTTEQTDLARKLWRDGLSASHIARRIGSVSRSAVIGKMHRLGCSEKSERRLVVPKPGPAKGSLANSPRNGANSPRHRTPDRPARPKRRMLSPVEVRMGHFPVEQRAPDEIRAAAAVKAKRVTIADLESHHCRFPLWETDSDPRHYCGCTPVDGYPYCIDHARLTYALPAVRRPAATVISGEPAVAAVRVFEPA